MFTSSNNASRHLFGALLLSLSSGAFACGGAQNAETTADPAQSEVATMAVESAAAETALEQAAAPTEAAQDALPGSRAATSRMAMQAPANPEVSMSRRAAGVVDILIRDLSGHCSPEPTVTEERREGSVLTLQVRPPEGPVARCMGRHNVQLRVEDEESTLETVVLLAQDGSEIVRGGLVPAREGDIRYAVESDRRTPMGGSPQTAVSASTEGGVLRVTVSELNHNCAVPPVLVPSRSGGSLTLTLQAIPEGTPLTRCGQKHEIVIRFDAGVDGVRAARLVGTDGTEIARHDW